MPPSVSVFGAAGFTGALTARLLHRHPSFELRSLTARSDVGRRLDDLYPHHRVPLELEELDLDRHAEVDAAVVAYPHGAAAPLVAELRDRGVRVVDLSADFRLHDADGLRALVPRAPGARAARVKRSTGCPSSTASRSAAPTSSRTRAAIRPRRCSRSRRWRGPD